ncbi:hypothetical protein AUK13_02790 [Candidatus Kuenenbacteria bacterium CG2_30_39_24]|uniref:Probable pectate lyase C n=1 Tax=Candidatus Kuenenbacteria bacterium CG2_30_39_24 TaxID=1805236 RepID=A0A1J5FDD3_9BACT|nr:MAG: hypothetical protein AUK13_02790 [Candidatus Kuenenbacteria bacterium CG2_30_39_24]
MKLFKFAYKIIRNRKLLLTTLAVVLAAMIIIPILILTLSTATTRANILRNNPLVVKMLPLYWQVRKVSDIFYLPYYFKKNKLPSYELTIADKDLKKLNDSLPKEFMNVVLTGRVFVPAEFKYDNKTYQVTVRYRGDNAVHWNAPKKSYLIEFNKDDLFNGYRQLSFIIPNDRYFAVEQLNNYRAEKLGLLYPPSFFANLKINGDNHGLYFVIENWNQEMLVKWQVPDESNFYGNDLPTQADGIERSDILWDNLDHWREYVGDSRYNYKHYSELFKLLYLLNDASDEEFYQNIWNIIDKDSLYGWQILQELGNANHHLSDNMRLYFNNTSGKFYFIPWDVEGGREGEAVDHLGLYGKLTGRIFKNPAFAFEKNKLLYDYAQNKDNGKDDLDFYDATYQNIKTALYQDRLKIYTNYSADGIYREFRQKTIDNFDNIKKAFDAAIVFMDVHVSDDDSLKFNNQNILAYFDFNVKSRAPLYLKKLDVSLLNDQLLENYFMYYDKNQNNLLDKNDILVKDFRDIALYTARQYNPETNKEDYSFAVHRFYLTSRILGAEAFSDSLQKFKFTLENAITGKEIKNKEISAKIINDRVFKYFSYISDIKKFIALNPIFKVEMATKQITLAPGSYYINQTIIIPSGYQLTIKPGVRLLLAPDVSIISYSPVTAVGSAHEPIIVSAQNPDSPWGSFGVLNAGVANHFSYVNFSNGRDDYINGVYFSGMLAVYHTPVKVEHCTFSYARADDALNIKSTSAEVLDSSFANNSADGIDFDFISQGRIANSYFFGNGNDAIDLSGSSVLIEGNYIEKSGDKGISIGEKTLETIIYNNVLNSCNIGIEIKDLSDIKIINNVIINNKTGLNAYQKKAVFGGGKAVVYNSIIWNNEADITFDQQSEIRIFNSDIASQDNNKNFSLEPLFKNQRSRDYTPQPLAGDLFNTAGDKNIIFNELHIQLDNAPVGLNK